MPKDYRDYLSWKKRLKALEDDVLKLERDLYEQRERHGRLLRHLRLQEVPMTEHIHLMEIPSGL